MAESSLPFPMQSPNEIARPSDLPSFEHPPVVEVALSVQFEPLMMQAKHVALLWQACSNEFPDWQDQPPIDPIFELFGPAMFFSTRLRHPPLQRSVFRNAASTQLKQYQADRFVRNWTKSTTAPEYPRYESIRDSFTSDLNALTTFLERHALGSFAPNQCEVTYVNLIPLGSDGVLTPADVISPWRGTYSDSFLYEPESSEASVHFLLTNAGRSIGRLHVQSTVVAYRGVEGKAIQLTLTSRGQPLGAGVQGVIEFLNLGREHIVKGFASYTTSKMHKIWGRIDGSK